MNPEITDIEVNTQASLTVVIVRLRSRMNIHGGEEFTQVNTEAFNSGNCNEKVSTEN